MKIKLTRNVVYNDRGDAGLDGQVVETDEKTAKLLIAIKKASPVEEPVVEETVEENQEEIIVEEPVVEEGENDPSA